jgi:multidrug transporter EmrE-like cation transporter
MWGFIWVSIVAIIEIFGDFHLRFYAQTGNIRYLLLGIIGYTGVVFGLIKSLQLNNVLFVNSIWDGMSGIFESAAAYFILGDRLKNKEQYIGLIFIFAGLFLMKQ